MPDLQVTAEPLTLSF